jgi:hypothetical protein
MSAEHDRAQTRFVIRRGFFSRHYHLYANGVWVASFLTLSALEHLCSGLFINELSEATVAASEKYPMYVKEIPK